jgi:fibronectin type 3 domain-containing protein
MKRQRLLTVSFAVFLWLMPSLVIAGSATISWQANTESDLQEYRVYTGTTSRAYGTPVSVGKATSYTVNNLQEGATYFFAVTAVDTSDNESGFSQEVSKTIADTHAPTVALTSPTTGTTYETPQGTLDLRGTAADNVGVVTVRWSNSRGGSGTANGTTTWSVSGITLVKGQNVITVTARDQAGNEGTYTLTVTYNPPDTTAPNPPVGVTVE